MAERATERSHELAKMDKEIDVMIKEKEARIAIAREATRSEEIKGKLAARTESHSQSPRYSGSPTCSFSIDRGGPAG